MTYIRKAVALSALAACLVYAALVALLWAKQERLLFPAPGHGGDIPDGFRKTQIMSSDGTRLEALYLPGPEPTSPAIVFFHGNGSLALTETGRARKLRDAGFAVLLAEYRGYGGSEGSPSEAGLVADGLASHDWLRERAAGPVHVYAHSLGTGVAVAVAAERDVAAVALEAPYSSIADVAASRYPLAPVSLLIRNPFRSDARIGGVSESILILHGGRDTVVPIRFGRRLKEFAPQAQWVEYPEAGHGLEGVDALERTVAFFRQS